MPRAKVKKSESKSLSGQLADPNTAPAEDFDALFDQMFAERKDKMVSTQIAPLATQTASNALEGELTVTRIAAINSTLKSLLVETKKNRREVGLDLSAVTECDGAGLQVLLAFALAARDADVSVMLVDTPPQMAALLDQYGVAKHFSLAALEAIS